MFSLFSYYNSLPCHLNKMRGCHKWLKQPLQGAKTAEMSVQCATNEGPALPPRLTALPTPNDVYHRLGPRLFVLFNLLMFSLT